MKGSFPSLIGTSHPGFHEFISYLSLISSYSEILPSASNVSSPHISIYHMFNFWLSFPIFLVLSILEFVILEFGESTS